MSKTLVEIFSEETAPLKPVRQRKGFAAMDPKLQRELASRGGKAAHKSGNAHEWGPEGARDAGRKGGLVSRGGKGKLPT